MTDAIVPFILDIEQARLDDLRRRLGLTRWPDAELVEDWSQGAPLAKVRALVEHWRTRYDWRRCEAALNGFGQFRTSIDGVDIHFLHVRSQHADALPLILTHGWPGSVVEFLKCIRPLVDPTAHGGDARDAFHVVIPSLPGYGFSGKPRERGWGVRRIAQAWHRLMQRLGYTRYVAQGGDWGAVVTTALGVERPDGLLAIHLNMQLVKPRDAGTELRADEQRMLDRLKFYARWDSGYAAQQSSRPQTLGYGLADSPVGQAAWIYEKFHAWTDNDGAPESTLTLDEMLDNIMLYWLPNAATSSARLYWESYRGAFFAAELHLPTGCSVFPKDIYTAPRSWAERCMHNLIYWNELDRGGHFAAFEQPRLFVEELRKCFRLIRVGN
ncbi:MAG: epoxide hydrolase family protein [Gammaproteobacteria bacterium]